VRIKARLTLIVPFGTAEDLNVKWVKHHLDLVPEWVRVICVENYQVPCYRTASMLRYASMTRKNWDVIYLPEMLLQGSIPTHAPALDAAVEYARTPYVMSLDSDFFIDNPQLFEDILRAAEEKGAVAVGALHICAVPYIHPSCALYKTDFIKEVKFEARYVSPEFVARFVDEEGKKLDGYVDVRLKQGFCDVGAFAYLKALSENLPAVNDFPVHAYGRHLWSRNPVLHYVDAGVLNRHVYTRLVLGDEPGVVVY